MPEERALGQIHPMGDRTGGDFTRILLGGQLDDRRDSNRSALVRGKMFGTRFFRAGFQSE